MSVTATRCWPSGAISTLRMRPRAPVDRSTYSTARKRAARRCMSQDSQRTIPPARICAPSWCRRPALAPHSPIQPRPACGGECRHRACPPRPATCLHFNAGGARSSDPTRSAGVYCRQCRWRAGAAPSTGRAQPLTKKMSVSQYGTAPWTTGRRSVTLATTSHTIRRPSVAPLATTPERAHRRQPRSRERVSMPSTGYDRSMELNRHTYPPTGRPAIRAGRRCCEGTCRV